MAGGAGEDQVFLVGRRGGVVVSPAHLHADPAWAADASVLAGLRRVAGDFSRTLGTPVRLEVFGATTEPALAVEATAR